MPSKKVVFINQNTKSRILLCLQDNITENKGTNQEPSIETDENASSAESSDTDSSQDSSNNSSSISTKKSSGESSCKSSDSESSDMPIDPPENKMNEHDQAVDEKQTKKRKTEVDTLYDKLSQPVYGRRIIKPVRR